MSITDRISNITKQHRLAIEARREELALLAQKRKEEAEIRFATKSLREMLSPDCKRIGGLEKCTALILEAIKSPDGVQLSLDFIHHMPWKLEVKEINSFVEVSGKGEELFFIFLGRLFDADGNTCWEYLGDPEEEGKAFYFAVLSLFIVMKAEHAEAHDFTTMASIILRAYHLEISNWDRRLGGMIRRVEEKGTFSHRPRTSFPQACYAALGKDGDGQEVATPAIYRGPVPPATASIGDVLLFKSGNDKQSRKTNQRSTGRTKAVIAKHR